MKRDRPIAENVLDAVMSESKRQADTLREMRLALEAGDDQRALEKAREVCGLDPSPKKSSQQEGTSDSEKNHRADPRIN